jgi:hypothetical protein
VDRKLDRFKHTVDETGTPMDTKDWRDFQMAKAKAHESAWLNFAARLTDDADAIFTTGGNS